MKKILLVFLMISSCAMMAQERFDLTPGYATCTYDATEQYFGEGWYKMKMVFKPAYNDHLPQTQVILYVSDTMAIAKPDTKFMAADFVFDPYNIFAVIPSRFDIVFKGYNTDYEIDYGIYSITLEGTLDEPDHTPITMNYEYMVAFVNSVGQLYTPEHETIETGVHLLSSPGVKAQKRMVNGQLIITVDSHEYNVFGIEI